jgi:hypothetical protein
MKGKPVEQLVYEYMFPKPRASDPQNFHALLQRHLVLEVRQEVHSYYGHLETPEAKYPGLDYCHPTHRIRLSRWQWHRRLFRAFDALRLTPNEIAGLTKWEGTKWAKERYEKEQGITIRDTTEDEFTPWTEPADRQPRQQQAFEEPGEGVDETMAEDSDDEPLASVGVDLNERLRERVDLRNVSGDLSMSLDDEWEQWLKNALETGELPEIADRIAQANGVPRSSPGSITPSSFPPRLITAARDGQWNDIPEYLHSILRSILAIEPRNTPPTPAPIPASQTSSSSHITNPITRQRETQSQLASTSIRNAFNELSSEVLASQQQLAVQQRMARQQRARQQQLILNARRTYSGLHLPAGDADLRDGTWSP